jgi:hypothetical protein
MRSSLRADRTRHYNRESAPTCSGELVESGNRACVGVLHDLDTPHPDLRLHAQIEILAAGYDLSVEVDLIDCGAADCSCPSR